MNLSLNIGVVLWKRDGSLPSALKPENICEHFQYLMWSDNASCKLFVMARNSTLTCRDGMRADRFRENPNVEV